MRVKVNSRALNEEIIARGLPQWKVCMLLNVASKTLVKMLERDCKIQTRTATKLRSVFGNKVVYVDGECTIEGDE